MQNALIQRTKDQLRSLQTLAEELRVQMALECISIFQKASKSIKPISKFRYKTKIRLFKNCGVA